MYSSRYVEAVGQQSKAMFAKSAKRLPIMISIFGPTTSICIQRLILESHNKSPMMQTVEHEAYFYSGSE